MVLQQNQSPGVKRGQTKEKLLRSAARLFARYGYAGVSIAEIARDLGLTKQALLHHFGNKDALYGAAVRLYAEPVLQRLYAVIDDDSTPEAQLRAFFLSLESWSLDHPDALQLIQRELMDQARPCEPCETCDPCEIKDLLDALVALLQGTERWAGRSHVEALAVICQLLGGLMLLVAARPGIETCLGARGYAAARAQFHAPFEEVLNGLLTGLLGPA